MNLSNFGAVRHSLLSAAVLAFLATSAAAQIVEKERTFADLTASHPCSSGYTGRNAIVTDCDAADDIGDGGGAFRCFAHCDGTAPWEAVSIGGGAGGSGTIGGTLGSTDNVAVCADGTGGATAQPCTGQALFPDGDAAAPGVTFSADADTGFYRVGSNALGIAIGGTQRFQLDVNAMYFFGGNLSGQGLAFLNGFKAVITANTAGVGSPAAVSGDDSLGVQTNEGATAKNYRTLMTASVGHQPRFCVQDADGLRITANTGDTIRVIDKVTASAGYIESTTIGSCVLLVALNATEWFAVSITGTWTDGTFTYDDTGLTTP